MSDDEHKYIVEDFANHEVQEYENTPVPLFLKCLYVILPIWGIISMYTFWDGSHGWLDRGYWHELQLASKTCKEKVESKPVSKTDSP